MTGVQHLISGSSCITSHQCEEASPSPRLRSAETDASSPPTCRKSAHPEPRSPHRQAAIAKPHCQSLVLSRRCVARGGLGVSGPPSTVTAFGFSQPYANSYALGARCRLTLRIPAVRRVLGMLCVRKHRIDALCFRAFFVGCSESCEEI